MNSSLKLSSKECDIIYKSISAEWRCLVVDCRATDPSFFRLGFLPYCKNGYYAEVCDVSARNSYSTWPVVFLVNSADVENPILGLYSEFINNEKQPILIDVKVMHILNRQTSLDVTAKRPLQCPVELWLVGQNEVRTSLLLPVKVNTQMVSNALNYFEIGLNGSEQCKGRAYELSSAEESHEDLDVSFDIRPDLDVYNEIAVNSSLCDIQEVAPRRLRKPEKLCLIFDRTCPSAGKLVDAKMVASGNRAFFAQRQSRQQSDRYSDSEDSEKGGTVVSNAHPVQVSDMISKARDEINRDIRNGVTKGIKQECEGIRCRLYSFADSIDGMGLPENLAENQEPFVPFGVLRCSDTIIRLESTEMSYAPGFDLWDALDDALHHARNSMESDRDIAPILVIGNSPPHLPPSSSILQCFGKNLELFSRSRFSSHTLLDDISYFRSKGIKIVYLFLRQPSVEENEFPIYRQLQNEVANWLKGLFHFIDVDATEDGVAMGISLAIEAIQYPSALEFEIVGGS